MDVSRYFPSFPSSPILSPFSLPHVLSSSGLAWPLSLPLLSLHCICLSFVVKSFPEPHQHWPTKQKHTATVVTPIFFTNSAMASFAPQDPTLSSSSSSGQEGESASILETLTATVTPHEHTEDCHHPSDGEDDNEIPPINRILYPGDVIDLTDDMELVYVNGTRVGKVTKIGGFEGMKNLQVLFPLDRPLALLIAVCHRN
jgi:hypothetical protein